MEEHVSYEATGRPSVFAQHNIQALLVKVTDGQMTHSDTYHKVTFTIHVEREAVQLFNRSKILFIFTFCVSKETTKVPNHYQT